MKKLNQKSFFSLLFFCLAFLFSCKTLPQGTHVKPLDLLQKDCGFYMAVPAKCDEQLIKRIIIQNVDNISPQNADMIAKKVNTVYLGVNRRYSNVDFYSTIDSAVPAKLASKMLSKKNGWDATSYTPQNSLSQYNYYSNGQIQLAFPASDITCIAKDVSKMLDKYDTIHSIPEDESLVENNYSELDSEIYEWLDGANDEIRFYAPNPQSFLYVLIGATLDIKLISVKGTFVQDKNLDTQYLLNLDFKFKSEKFLKAGKAILAMAFGLTNSQVTSLSPTELRISDIKIKKEQLYKLLII